MNEMDKLHAMLLNAGINHIFTPMSPSFYGENALQIRIYSDDTFQEELDDVVFHNFSHGNQLGLLETCCLGECNGYETAEQVFKGWMEMFFS